MLGHMTTKQWSHPEPSSLPGASAPLSATLLPLEGPPTHLGEATTESLDTARRGCEARALGPKSKGHSSFNSWLPQGEPAAGGSRRDKGRMAQPQCHSMVRGCLPPELPSSQSGGPLPSGSGILSCCSKQNQDLETMSSLNS